MEAEEDDSPGAPEWIVTFSDMISLLVTFFVLLLSFASLAEKEQPRMKQFLRGMWGVFPSEKGSAVELPEEELSPDRTYRVTASLERSSRPFEEVLHELERAGRRADDERVEIDLSTNTDGIRLHFGESCRFPPGDDRAPFALETALTRIADVVRHYQLEVVVESRSDAVFYPSERFPSGTSLSLSRAASAAAVLTRSGKLDPSRVSLADLDAHQPLGRGHADRGIQLRLVPVQGL
ncbi:MAG: hypothetical protein JNK02_17440 [Planctomycetes bacterium]|nr:hypothetical protein [Planctomycetota bacterium]